MRDNVIWSVDIYYVVKIWPSNANSFDFPTKEDYWQITIIKAINKI